LLGEITTLLNYLLITVAAIFVIVNPLTTAFVFMSLLPYASDRRREQVARRAVLMSTSIFFVFALLGGIIFQLFGITLEAFRIAGGIILFGIAMGMIRQGTGESEQSALLEGDDDGDHSPAAKHAQSLAIIPLAIPFISGPGSIATVMILTSEAPTIWHVGLVFVAILITAFACYYAMLYSRVLVERLGDSGKVIVTKVFGLILAVIAVQFVINGVSDVWLSMAAAA